MFGNQWAKEVGRTEPATLGTSHLWWGSFWIQPVNQLILPSHRDVHEVHKSSLYRTTNACMSYFCFSSPISYKILGNERWFLMVTFCYLIKPPLSWPISYLWVGKQTQSRRSFWADIIKYNNTLRIRLKSMLDFFFICFLKMASEDKK